MFPSADHTTSQAGLASQMLAIIAADAQPSERDDHISIDSVLTT